jgi:hypothetical protein
MRRRLARIVRRRGARRADRLTLGLAAVAVATAGTVILGEGVRLARRRIQGSPKPEVPLETAGRATQDAVAVLVEGYEASSRTEKVLFNMLTGFVSAFALIRLSTAGIRGGWWPAGNVRLGGRHIHHFVPGILTAFAAGAAALFAHDVRLRETLAIPLGAGIGLTFDESALLLELEDVYWTREGLVGVQITLATASLLAAAFLAMRILRRGERTKEERHELPPPVRDPFAV